jgi:APA family basic amino acid/polyamine antiporter
MIPWFEPMYCIRRRNNNTRAKQEILFWNSDRHRCFEHDWNRIVHDTGIPGGIHTLRRSDPVVVAIGGIQALCGALVYRILSRKFPASGGEYTYLSAMIGSSTGFVAGWISAIVGFSAPIALAAVALGGYASRVIPVPIVGTAAAAVVIVSILNSHRMVISGRFQGWTTVLKVMVILFFIMSGVWMIITGSVPSASFTFDGTMVISSSFAVSLVYVSFAYSGWNAATYLSGEMEQPMVNVGRSLLYGTLLVTVVYVAVNTVFLLTVPLAEAAGVVEIGHLAALKIFGRTGGSIMSAALSLLLLSTISAMTIAGSHLLAVFAAKHSFLSFIRRKSGQSLPVRAVYLQMAITLALIVTATYEQVLTGAGFTLALSTFVTVSAFLLHWKRLTAVDSSMMRLGTFSAALIFVALNGWMLVYLAVARPMEAMTGIGVCVAGYAIFYGTGQHRSAEGAEDHRLQVPAMQQIPGGSE